MHVDRGRHLVIGCPRGAGVGGTGAGTLGPRDNVPHAPLHHAIQPPIGMVTALTDTRSELCPEPSPLRPVNEGLRRVDTFKTICILN